MITSTATIANFGPTWSGRSTSVYYTVVSSTGTTLIANTNTGVTETITGSGLYQVTVPFDDSWGLVRVLWNITGTSVAIATIVDSARPADRGYSLTGATPLNVMFGASATGQASSTQVQIVDQIGTIQYAFSATGVSELISGSGLYGVNVTINPVWGFCQIVWKLVMGGITRTASFIASPAVTSSTSLSVQISEILTQVNKLQFDGSNFVKSDPQTVVTLPTTPPSGYGSTGGLTEQQVRDAMALPTTATIQPGSIDANILSRLASSNYVPPDLASGAEALVILNKIKINADGTLNLNDNAAMVNIIDALKTYNVAKRSDIVKAIVIG